MCGIVGGVDKSISEEIVTSMVQTLRHRGPDGMGVMRADDMCVFGHARLAIMDLSENGKQPMLSQNGLVMAVANGEIYNYQTIQKELMDEGIVFYSNSDSEVLANGYQVWGSKIIEKLNGIFALALYDIASKKLILARDRCGVKPLYYFENDEMIAFASELKALRTHPFIPFQLDSHSMWEYLAYRYIPAPKTIYCDVKKLLPAHYLEYHVGEKTKLRCYWQPSIKEQSTDEETLKTVLSTTLHRAIQSQLMSDVPVGVLLSGGIDSSAITAIAASLNPNLKAFCCGFEEEAYDERPYARLSASCAHVELHESVMTWEKLFSYLPQYIDWFDEPFFNYSAVAIHELCLMAKEQGIKVVLAGEGADEMYAGYRWYDDLTDVSSNTKANFLEQFFLAKGFFTHTLMEKLKGETVSINHLALLQSYDNSHLSPIMRGQIIDFHTFLPDDVLCRDDRASMATGIELRVPFLDNEMLQKCFLWSDAWTHRNKERKYILKQALVGYVDNAILTSRKKGFGFPLNEWGDKIKAFAKEILYNGALIRQGFASSQGMHERVEGSNAHVAWLLITAELWCRRYLNDEDIDRLCKEYQERVQKSAT